MSAGYIYYKEVKKKIKYLFCLQQKSPEEETLLELNLMICLVAHYFDQGDLADKTWHHLSVASYCVTRKRRLSIASSQGTPALTGEDFTSLLYAASGFLSHGLNSFILIEQRRPDIFTKHHIVWPGKHDLTSSLYKSLSWTRKKQDLISPLSASVTFTRKTRRHHLSTKHHIFCHERLSS